MRSTVVLVHGVGAPAEQRLDRRQSLEACAQHGFDAILRQAVVGLKIILLYQFALLTYLTSFMNMNPLLKLDGYYILMDWLEIPRLREKSLAFVGQPLRAKVRKREAWTRDEKIFAVFGALSGVWTVIALSLATSVAASLPIPEKK